MTEKRSTSRFSVIDLLGIMGLSMLGYGFWMAWEPLGLIVPGALLVSAAVSGARRQ